MIISHKYEFIFIKTLKTAGTSIEVFLSQICSDNDIVTPIFPHIEPHVARNFHGIWNPLPELLGKNTNGIRKELRDYIQHKKFYNHIPALKIKNRVPKDIWNNYYKFCVERNPWDKTISDYHMKNDRSGGNLSLSNYLENGPFCLNLPKYTDTEGNLIVDRVIKYESLMEELDEIFHQLGIPFKGSLGVKAKSEHRQDRVSYREIYSKEQKELIKNIFSKEIALHGYTY